MKGKKLCIGLLIFFTTCLLSLNLSLNASAIKNTSNHYPSSLTYKYAPNGGTQNAPITQNQYVDYLNFDVPYHTLANIYDFDINLRDSMTLSKTKKFKARIIFQTEDNGGGNIFSSPTCPLTGRGSWIIDNCSLEMADKETALNRLYQYIYSQGGTAIPYYYTADDTTFSYYIMTIDGHYNSDNDTTVTRLAFGGQFFFVYNQLDSTTPLTLNLKLRLYFSPILQYEDEENAEDEAAEKELEDRDNLESQSTSTDSEANNAGQSAENTGTTLFAAFTQFFNALTNVSGTSCVLPRMQVYSLDLGQMDLCTFDIPPQIMALVSIGMVFIIVPLGIHLVKRMINLYKEITG